MVFLTPQCLRVSAVKDKTFVDSLSADVTVIPRRLGEFLGFVIEQHEISEICGIGDAVVPIIVKNIRMDIGEREFDAQIAWAMINDIPPLLGRPDVFDRFDTRVQAEREEGNLQVGVTVWRRICG